MTTKGQFDIPKIEERLSERLFFSTPSLCPENTPPPTYDIVSLTHLRCSPNIPPIHPINS